ncbi:hypothetical protein BaRGS_00019611 [Batillaria attramentaria]|uniref:Uncharacterized protein n=1 Tax=Batillaria attramentaria TaxID=370345 RepID=A0ABD0KPM6_9CAEN
MYTNVSSTRFPRNKGRKAKVPFTCCRPVSSDVLSETSEWDVSIMQYKLQNESCPVEPTATNSHYNDGCYYRLNRIYERIVIMFLVVVALIVVIEVAAWVTAFRLARCLQRTFSDFDLW